MVLPNRLYGENTSIRYISVRMQEEEPPPPPVKGILKRRTPTPSPTPPPPVPKRRSFTRRVRKSLSKIVPRSIRSRFTRRRTPTPPVKEPKPTREPKPKKKVEFSPSTKPAPPKAKIMSLDGIDIYSEGDTPTNKSTLCKNGIKPVFKHIIKYVDPSTGKRTRKVYNYDAYEKYIKYYNKASPNFDNYGCGPNMRLKYEEGHYCCVDPSEQATDVQILDHIYMLIDSLLENVSFLDITREYSYHPRTEVSIESNAIKLGELAGHWMSLYKKVLEENQEFEDKEGLELYERATAKLREIKEFFQEKRKPYKYESDDLALIRQMEEERKPDGSNVYGYRKVDDGRRRKTF